MSTNINFDKKLGITGVTGITLPTSSTPSFQNLNSFLFDGVDDTLFSTSNYTELNGTQNFSISFWIKPIGTNTNGVWEILTQGNSERLTCIYRGVNERIEVQFRSQSYYHTTINNSVVPNQWSHIVYTYNGALGRYDRPELYVNGVLSQGVSSGVPYSSSNFNGTLTFGDSVFYTHGNNYIDEFSVWNNTTLTGSQANELYNGGTPSDLNNIASGLTSPTTWLRMGDTAIWNGFIWTMTDVNGGLVTRGANMVEANRTTDVPTASTFSNTQSILLDGVDDYVSVPNSTSLNITTAMSVSMWFKTTSSSGMYPLTQGSGSEIKYYVQFYAPINRIRVLIFDGNSVTTTIDNTQVFNDGQWHNLTFTTDALTTTNGVKVYFDSNILSNKGTLNNNGIRSASSGLFIGQIPNTARFNGNIDEVSIFNSELSQSDITSIYGGGVPSSLSSYSSLVSWWRFEGSGTTAIDSGSGGNDGTLVNGVVRSTDVPTIPFSTKSIALDGVDDFVDMGDVLDFERTSAFSISAWIKRGGIGVNDTIVSKMESSGNFRGYLLFISGTNQIRFILRSQNNNSQRLYVYSNTTITDTNYHNIVITYNGNSATSGFEMYLDGVNISTTFQGSLSQTTLNSAPFNIGARNSNGLFATATIDEVSIFNSELSQSNVTSIYNGGVPNDISSLSPLSWWRCGDGDTAPTLTDNGSASNDGTMTNFTTFSTDVPT